MKYKLIKDEYDRVCVLGRQAYSPSSPSLRLLRNVSDTAYLAYPIIGGSTVVNLEKVEFLTRELTTEEYECILGLGVHTYNPASSKVLALII